jgi:aryl-phospho-beta-D-glucosidase BglC (GH1 family)
MMKRYGFNFLWMFAKADAPPPGPDRTELEFLVAEGFEFVRIPTDYRFWTRDFDYLHLDEEALRCVDTCISTTREYALHVCLNMHRAPGYCINRNELEKHSLWTDREAQDGFVHQWRTFAQRYADVPPEDLSFDLVNEPPNVGQYGMTRENHERIMRRTAAAIREITPDRPVVIDGLGGGNIAIPELTDLRAIHSCRGYQPMPISHYQTRWWRDQKGAPAPTWPGIEYKGQTWDHDALVGFYRPWRDVEAHGVTVHVGEFGCFNKTPQDVALRWLGDLLSVFRQFGWGYAMWNFRGSFGIVDHGRDGARIEKRHGIDVDRDMLELLKQNRTD